LGREGVSFFSKSTLVNSELEVNDAALTCFTTQHSTVYGRTNFLSIPTIKGLAEGDLAEFYSSSLESPDRSSSIYQIFTDKVIKLADSIASNVSWPLGPLSILPFLMFKAAKVTDFTTFSEALASWVSSINVKVFFDNLNGCIRPLLVNENPTDSLIGSAETQVSYLQSSLSTLQSLLSSYIAQPVPEVDALLKSFKEKGSDRALDILLACRFTTFFGLTQDGLSYAGAAQDAVRQVASQDLPVRKTNRLASNKSQLRFSAESPDFEYDSSDVDRTPTPDPTWGGDIGK
jgi:hypothetical protein